MNAPPQTPPPLKEFVSQVPNVQMVAVRHQEIVPLDLEVWSFFILQIFIYIDFKSAVSSPQTLVETL